MNWNLFWTAFGAIGTTAGAFATATAVIVALWQTKYSTKKKLKLQFNDSIQLYNNSTNSIIGRYIGVTIINSGNRKIVISDWSILLKNKTRFIIMTEIQGVLKVQLPATIEIEEKLDVSYESVFFQRCIRGAIEKKEIDANKKIKFQILDSTGKKYYIYSKKKAMEYLNEDLSLDK